MQVQQRHVVVMSPEDARRWVSETSRESVIACSKPKDITQSNTKARSSTGTAVSGIVCTALFISKSRKYVNDYSARVQSLSTSLIN